MHKLREVEEARRILNEGKDWSIWRWLFEKKRVRIAADAGTAALDELEKKVKSGWSEDLKKAYRELQGLQAARATPRAQRRSDLTNVHDPDSPVMRAVRKVKEADDIATGARLDAEAIFDQAEKRLSGGMAREGAEKALEAYDLREKAIRRAEAASRGKAAVSGQES